MATLTFHLDSTYADIHIEDIPRASVGYILDFIGIDMGNEAALELLDQLEADGYFTIAPLEEEPEWA